MKRTKFTQNVLEISEQIGHDIAGKFLAQSAPVDWVKDTLRCYIEIDTEKGVMQVGPVTLNASDIEEA